MKNDVFISYSRRDFDEVKDLIRNMQQAVNGLTVWFDVTGIESGEVFSEKIVSAIEHSRIVLFMISDNSMASPWTKKEVMYANNIGKRIVPVLLHGAKLSGWFLFEFGNVDYILYDDSRQWNKFLGNLSAWLGKSNPKQPEKTASPLLGSQKANILYNLVVMSFGAISAAVFLMADYPNTKAICLVAFVACLASACGKRLCSNSLWINTFLSAFFLLATCALARLSILPYIALCALVMLPLSWQWRKEKIRWSSILRYTSRSERIWKCIAASTICAWLAYGCIALPAVCASKGFRGIPLFNRFAAEYLLANAGFSFAQYRVALTYENGIYYVSKNVEAAAYWYQKAAEGGCQEARKRIGADR